MKRIIFFLVTAALMLNCGTAEAQIGGILGRAAERAAERAVTRKVEEKVESEVSKAIDKTIETKEKEAEAKAKDAKEAKDAKDAKDAKAGKSEPASSEPLKGGAVNANKFPFAQGSYVLESTALGITVKTTVYFSNSGDWRAEETKAEAKLLRKKEDKLKITKGNKIWDLDLLAKTGTYFEFDGSLGSAEAALVASMGGAATEGMEVTELGTENYLGYPCRKFNVVNPNSNMDMTCLSYGTLLMKSEGRMGPMKTSSRIISIDLKAPPASIFEVPAGIKVETLEMSTM